MRSWIFFRSLFYQTLFYSLAASFVAKLTINIAIKPVSSESGLALPRWQTYPSPPGISPSLILNIGMTDGQITLTV
jgi:hypothetical protein